MALDSIDDVKYLYATNYFGFASYLVLVWDHLITFDDEVKYIWKAGRKKTLIIYLFLLNRYLIPLGFILNLFAYLSPVWTPELCAHFVRTEGALTLIGLSVAALMMMIRVTAIYAGNRYILGLLVFLFLLQLGVYSWLMTDGIPVAHSSGARACSMIFSPAAGIWAASSAWLPWIYDTVIFSLTLYKTVHVMRANKAHQGSSVSLARTLARDGLSYYSLIFVANATLVLMIIYAPDGLKNICAQFELLITVTMMSRITLSLRKNVRRNDDEWIQPPNTSFSHVTATRSMAIWTFGMGDKPRHGSRSKSRSRNHNNLDEFSDSDLEDDFNSSEMSCLDLRAGTGSSRPSSRFAQSYEPPGVEVTITTHTTVHRSNSDYSFEPSREDLSIYTPPTPMPRAWRSSESTTR